MTVSRDDATKIARRIMARIEDERTIHLDSMVDEIVAGMALVTEVAPNRPSKARPGAAFTKEMVAGAGWSDRDMINAGYMQIFPGGYWKHDVLVDNSALKGSATIDEPGGWVPNDALKGLMKSKAPWEAQHDDDHAQPLDPLPAAGNPHGYAHEECHGVWSQQQMLDAGYHNDLQKMRYVPAKPFDMPIGTRLMLEFDATVPAGWKLISMTTEELLIEKVHD